MMPWLNKKKSAISCPPELNLASRFHRIESCHKIGGLAIFRRARSSLSPSRSLRVKQMALDHPLQTEERINTIVPERRLDQQQSIPAQTRQGVGTSAPQLTAKTARSIRMKVHKELRILGSASHKARSANEMSDAPVTPTTLRASHSEDR